MEHRYAERKPLVMNVVVSCPRIGLVRGVAENVGMGGMFIATDCVVMPMHAPVSVAFQPSPNDNLICVQARGMVVHQNTRGFGLMFDELEPACREALRRLLDTQVVQEEAEMARLPLAAAR
jgi:hypothetical protein